MSLHSGHFQLKMVWKRPQNQLFAEQISIIVSCELLSGCQESIIKISTYVEKMAENLDFQLNSLPWLAWKARTCQIRQNSVSH